MKSGLDKLIENIPSMHIRTDAAGDPFFCVGGLTKGKLLWLRDLVDRYFDDPADHRVLETGAGVSTLFFLIAGFRQVTSVAPSLTLERQITGKGRMFGAPLENLNYKLGRAEMILPDLVKVTPKEQLASLVFLDGDHGWPNVFVDFCYTNMMLRKGGLLILDDCQYHSVRELMQFLEDEPDWHLLCRHGKTTVLQKLTHETLTYGAGRKYIAENTAKLPPLEDLEFQALKAPVNN